MAGWMLYHYGVSPYAEKARLLLGHKQLAWGSIEVPVIPPRPGLQKVLGGFRRIPVLQRGADFFCDTRLLPHVLDSVHPERPLLPRHAWVVSTLIAQWVEPRVFLMMGPVRFESRDDLQALEAMGLVPGDFLRDRAPFMAPAVDTRRSGTVRASARDHVVSYLALLEALLDNGQGYLCGSEPCAADFSGYHTVWWLRAAPRRHALLDRFSALGAWADRMAAIGHGRPRPTSIDEGLQAACDAQADAGWQPDWPAVNDVRLGCEVSLQPDDYGRDPVFGTLTAVTERHFTLTREAPDIGWVRLHFPKVGYEVVLAEAA
ncbi:MAG: glutathione S-transferase family protein [Burkholderiaceae bacterium]|nr:glutathione S-transferase family protein [Burkholderiaceae bacterium]